MQDVFQKYAGHVVDPKTQEVINKPLQDDTGFNEGHEEFLKMLIDKIESGELNPVVQDTLYNMEAYEKLSEEDKEATDITGTNILSLVRQIEKVWKVDQKASFQIQNLVETLFQTKSKFEEKHGDVYII